MFMCVNWANEFIYKNVILKMLVERYENVEYFRPESYMQSLDLTFLEKGVPFFFIKCYSLQTAVWVMFVKIAGNRIAGNWLPESPFHNHRAEVGSGFGLERLHTNS